MKPKISRRKEIIKIAMEINQRQKKNRKNQRNYEVVIEKIKQTKL